MVANSLKATIYVDDFLFQGGGSSPTVSTTAALTQTSTVTQTPLPGKQVSIPSQTPTSAAAFPASTSFTFSPVADTYVSQASPGSAYGSATSFSVVDSPSAKQAFIRFDVTGLPAGASVSSAKLRLFVTNNSTSGGIFHRITNTIWPENIIWASAEPSLTKPPIDGAQLASLGSVKLNQVVEVALPAGTITGNGSYSFAITLLSANTNTLGYASREATTAANRPQLMVTTQ
jgi:hypothetical protein